MGTYTNEAGAEQKAATAKTEVLQAFAEFEASLMECAKNTGAAALVSSDAQLLGQLCRCLEEMRTGVQQVHAVVEREWPE